MTEASRIERVQSATNLVWLDLEMTGLDPTRDVILQAALVVTNAALESLEEYAADVWQPEAALASMVPFVREMHQKTGLSARIAGSKTDLRAVERQLMERVTGWCPYGAVLCGNSVHNDKAFIDRWMPALAGYLSYRLVDVSSFKVLAKLWYGPDAVFKKPKEGEHDAIVDIRNSIAELAFYRERLMRPASG
ncbi:MAG: oligoribonuclease [Myxococcales bacterium]|nr:oligoribonuclease [Myxococcales bacterium]